MIRSSVLVCSEDSNDGDDFVHRWCKLESCGMGEGCRRTYMGEGKIFAFFSKLATYYTRLCLHGDYHKEYYILYTCTNWHFEYHLM